MKLTLTGIAQAILKNISEIAGMNDPQLKVSPVGFLKMLLENNAMTPVNNLPELQAGQDVDVKVRYMQRGIESEVTDRDDCDADVTPEWKETTIGHALYSKIGIVITDAQMRKYQAAATDPTSLGAEGASVSRALYETILTHVNALISKIDRNLVAAQALKFGVNAAYGNSNAQRIALGTKADMNDGVVKLIMDSETNEINDQLLVCGNGLVRAFDIYNKLKTGVDSQGFGALDLRAYSDPKTTTGWGTNHFGVFAKGTIGFVDINKYVGEYAGEHGGSYFFSLPMPVQINGVVLPINFDCQLKYEDCPIYEDGTKIADRGWKLFISKTYGLFNLPSDSFKSGDPLAGVNGAFHYVAVEQDDTYNVRVKEDGSESESSSSEQ